MQLRSLFPLLGPALRHGPGTFALAALIGTGIVATGTAAGANVAVGHKVVVQVEGLRSARGQILACLTLQAKGFPDCTHDASARQVKVPAGSAAEIDFGPVPAGTYAVSLLHDENGNGKMDMAIMIPREGFGFSRNPAIAFGPPRFARAAFAVGGQDVRETVRMRYMF